MKQKVKTSQETADQKASAEGKRSDIQRGIRGKRKMERVDGGDERERCEKVSTDNGATLSRYNSYKTVTWFWLKSTNEKESNTLVAPNLYETCSSLLGRPPLKKRIFFKKFHFRLQSIH